MAGYYKIPKDITGRKWFGDPVTMYFYLRVAIKADEEGGSFNTSISKLAHDFGLSVKQVRGSLAKLIRANDVASERASKGTQITICNSDCYKGTSKARGQGAGQGIGQTYTPPFGPSPSFPAPLSPTPPISPSQKKTANAVKESIEDSVNRVYASYPTKCPVNGRATGKSFRDKEHIAKLLKDGRYSADSLINSIQRYVEDCTSTQTFIKNFSTFLNNIPDYSEDFTPQTPRQDTNGRVSHFDVATGGFDF